MPTTVSTPTLVDRYIEAFPGSRERFQTAAAFREVLKGLPKG